MQLYNGKIRLGGQVTNEVRKTDMTAAEIEVLRSIHGADAVVDIVATRNDRREHAAERRRIQMTYANPEENNADNLKRKMQTIRDLFGHESNPLPDRLAELVPEEVVAEKPKRAKIDPAEQAVLA